MSDTAGIINELSKKYGTSIVRLNGSDPVGNVDVIPTMLAPLDIATGIGGIPIGYFTEIFSREGVGKTTLCLHIIACAQKMGIDTAFIDMEHRLDPTWASTIGVDLSRLYITQPPYGEAALNIARALIESAGIRLIVIDSIPALVPKKELDGEVGDQFVGLQARMIAQNFRQVTPLLKSRGASIIFTNQIRAEFSGGSLAYGPKQATPGGWAVKFYASMRLDLKRVKKITDSSGDVVGQDVMVTVIKTSLSVPYRTALIRLTFDKGFDSAESIVDLASKIGLIEQSGSWFTVGDQKVQGRSALAEYLETSGLITGLYNKIMRMYLPQVGKDETTD